VREERETALIGLHQLFLSLSLSLSLFSLLPLSFPPDFKGHLLVGRFRRKRRAGYAP